MTKKEIIKSLVELKFFLFSKGIDDRREEVIKLDNVIKELSKKALCDKEKIKRNARFNTNYLGEKHLEIDMTFSLKGGKCCNANVTEKEYCTAMLLDELIQWFEDGLLCLKQIEI